MYLILCMVSAVLIIPALRTSAQDTTYMDMEEFSEHEFGQMQKILNKQHLLNRAIDIQKPFLEKCKDLENFVFNEQDWVTLLYAYDISLLKDSPQRRKTSAIIEKIFVYETTGYIEDEIMTIPVGVLNFKGDLINEEHFLNGNIAYENNQFVAHNNSKGMFSQYNIHLASLLLSGEIPREKIYLKLDSDFLITDGYTVDYVEVTINSEIIRLDIDKKVLVDLTRATLPLKFTTYFRSGETSKNNYEPQSKGLITPPDLAFDPNVFRGNKFSYRTEDASGLELRYGIIYGACNRSGKLRKPVIMLHGYRPPIQNIWPTLETLYHTKFNFKGADYGGAGFVDLLVQNGYDVVICRIDPGYESIEKGGRLMAGFIKNIVNPQKAAIGSKFENIVLGFSMGGQYWRYALMKMEKEHLEGSAPNHQTRMWIPVDSPHEGANVPLGYQFAAWSLKNHPGGGIALNVAYEGLMTNGSKDQMRYHFDGNPGNNGAWHRFHPNRSYMLGVLHNDFYLGNGLTRYRDYPSASRNVAVSAGNNSENDYPSLSAGDALYREQSAFTPAIYRKRWDVLVNAAKFVPHPSPIYPAELYHRKITFKWLWSSNVNVMVNDFAFNYNVLEMDNGQGSYHNDIPNVVKGALKVNSLFGFTDYEYDKNLAFVPILSALAINPRFWPNNMRLNLKTFKLMYNSFNLGTSGISDYYGYPHLGRPNDYNQVTPMDAIYCGLKSFKHIDLVNDQSRLIEFLLNEVEPWSLDLQNQELGEYARTDYVYKAKYQAKNKIRTGKDITPKTPFGEYITRPNSDLELQSGEIIEFKPGTHFQQGSVVHAYIEELCYGKSAKSMPVDGDYVHDNERPAAIETREETTRHSGSMIYPNPSNGTFTVYCDELKEGEKVTLFIYDAQGKQILATAIQNNHVIELGGSLKQNNILVGKIMLNGRVVCESKILISR
jgi:hypothetical protein